MPKTTFSLIVPIYGVEKYIERFAHSVLNQKYEYIQYIFINDGTKDASIEILQNLINSEYSNKKDQITIINQENKGLPKTREVGLKYATGDFILHVDSDDWLEEDAFEKLAKHIEENPESEIVFFSFKPEGDPKFKIKQKYHFEDIKDRDEFIKGLFIGKSYAYVWHKCVKRSIYQNHEIIFPKYNMHEDVHLMSQVIHYAKHFSFLPEELYHYNRANPGSITRESEKRQRQERVLNMLDLYEHYKGTDDNPIKDVQKRIIFHSAWSCIKFNFDILKNYPDVIKDIKKSTISKKNYMPIAKQIIVKARYLFY